MISSFRESLPSEFVRNTIALCRTRGESWLDALPETIRRLEREWSLTVGKPFPNIGYNFVAPATFHDGSSAVIKIGLPLDNIEIYGEAKYLRTLDGRGAIRLLKEDRKLEAILVERAVPGETLTNIFSKRPHEAIAQAINVLRQTLHAPPLDRADTISLDDWFQGLNRYTEKRFPAEYARFALEIYERLSRQPNRTFYLHGDFHPDNIVSGDRSAFVLIDPKGIVGHIGYEIAVFLNNFHWWQKTLPDIRERLDRVVDDFASAFDLEPAELEQWAFAQMVLSAWWTFDEMPEIYSDEVQNADIWRL